MSKQVKGVWVVPEKQVKEFLKPGGPDYNQLIADCLTELKYTRKLKVNTELSEPKRTKKKSYFEFSF